MKLKIVYNICERKGKTSWFPIGRGFLNADGSMDVKLTSLPIDGKLHIRDHVPTEDELLQQENLPGRAEWLENS